MVVEFLVGLVAGAALMWAARKYAGPAAAEVAKIEAELKAKLDAMKPPEA